MSVPHETPREEIRRRNIESMSHRGGEARARMKRNAEMVRKKLGLPMRKRDKFILIMNLALFIFVSWFFFGGGGPPIQSY